MKMVDHARLVQALQDMSLLVACKIDPEKQSNAARQLQRSITTLLGELDKDWCELLPQSSAQPSVGVPD